jgi:hypothetical protein
MVSDSWRHIYVTGDSIVFQSTKGVSAVRTSIGQWTIPIKRL